MLLAIIDDGFFDWLFCVEFTLKKTQKQKTIFTSTKNMRSNWLHFFAKIKFISFYLANKRVKTTSLSPIKIFNSSVFFFFFCVYYTSKKSNQTKMMIGYLNLCIKTDAHFVTVMGHLCGFGEVFVRLWVWSLYGHSAVCMRLQCGVCAILVHYNTVFVRLRCDFAFGAALS